MLFDPVNIADLVYCRQQSCCPAVNRFANEIRKELEKSHGQKVAVHDALTMVNFFWSGFTINSIIEQAHMRACT